MERRDGMASSLNIIVTDDYDRLKRVVGVSREYFDRIVVVNGNPDDEQTISFLEDMDCEIIDRPWDDNFDGAYHAHLDEMNVGDTVLIMDSDEVPSHELLKGVKSLTPWNIEEDMVLIPNILHINDVPTARYQDIPQEYSQGMFTKPVLFRYDNNKTHARGAHVSVIGSKFTYRPWPYYHLKTAESFVENDVYHMFLDPANQGLSGDEVQRLQGIYSSLGIDSKEKLYDLFQKTHPAVMKETMPDLYSLIVEWAEFIDNPKSRLAWWYFFYCWPRTSHPLDIEREWIETKYRRRWVKL